MKKFLLIAALAVRAHPDFAQCPSSIPLNNKAVCLGSAILNISSKDTLTSITWYRDGTPLGTVRDSMANAIQTIAGGNGRGPGLNQTNFPLDILLDGTGAIYVLDQDDVKWFPPGSSGATNGLILAGGNGTGSASNQFNNPTGLFVDRAGNIYVADAINNRIQKWRPGGAVGKTVAGTGVAGPASDQLSSPRGVFLDGDGNMYVSDNGNNRVQRFTPGDVNGTTVAGGNGAGPAANQFDGIGGLFVDETGNVYVADAGNNRVQEWAPGAAGGVTVAGGNGPGSAANQLNDPEDLFIDADGNVYVSDRGNYRVQEWALGAATGVTVAGGNGPGGTQDQIQFPAGLEVDDQGFVCIADAANNRVQKWATLPAINTVYIPSQAGTYTAVVTDTAGCSMTSNAVLIYASGTASVAVAASSDNICSGDTVLFTATPSNGGATPAYQWRINGKKAGSNSDQLSVHTLADGDSVYCILFSSQTCVSSVSSQDTIVMIVRAVPAIRMADDTIIAPGSIIPLHPSVNGNITSWQWTPRTGLNDPSGPSPLANPVISTTYQLNVVADNGCMAGGKTHVTVYYTLRMPAAFTPNGDGKNDLFRIPPSQTQKITGFAVYNRWGQQLFMTKNSGEGWDGTFQHQHAPPGAYIWAITYQDLLTGEVINARGTVLLIR